MSGLKKKMYLTIACFLVIWPLLQHGLVCVYGINPWRFFGWAMYAVPSPTLRISHQFSTVETPRQVKETARYKRTLKRFSQQRAHWGDLETPQQLADVLFELVPEGRELRITISSVFLEPKTAMLQERAQTYTFSRLSD